MSVHAQHSMSLHYILLSSCSPGTLVRLSRAKHMQMAFQLLSLSFHFSFPKKENNTCMRKSTIPRIKRTPCSFPGSALLWPAQHVRLVTLSGYIFCSSKKDMLWGHSTPTFYKFKKKWVEVVGWFTVYRIATYCKIQQHQMARAQPIEILYVFIFRLFF